MRVSAPALQPLIAAWVPTQRWFAGKGRDCVITARELVVVAFGPREFTIWLADVVFDDGGTETYQLPLVFRTEPEPTLEHVLLGQLRHEEKHYWIYDALHDHDVTPAYLIGFRAQATEGPLVFERFVDADALRSDRPSLVLTGEQSNTSLIFGDHSILKVFRRLEPGINPDIEVQRALGALGARHVAQLLGAVTATIDGGPVSLGMLAEFLNSGTDGWELGQTSVRDLMAEADLHAEEAGGDFASEAYRLGEAVAQVHADLAVAFGTSVLPAVDRLARAQLMHTRLDRALAIVPELGAVESGLRAAFEEFGTAPVPLSTQRIHGDLHLGQALRTVRRWVLLDFEGEPTVSIAQRREFDSPLRDVAGMLRSFDYAARYSLVEGGASAQLQYRAEEWAERNRDAFCAGYAAGSGHGLTENEAAIRGFEADKAVYEAVYEARNRPPWLMVPLLSLARLVKVADRGSATAGPVAQPGAQADPM